MDQNIEFREPNKTEKKTKNQRNVRHMVDLY